MAALKKALSEAEDKVAKERTEREKQEARVGELQQELKDFFKKYESLERDSKTQESELAKALQSAHDAKVEAQKAFNMQSKYAAKQYLLLTRVQSFPGAFADLP